MSRIERRLDEIKEDLQKRFPERLAAIFLDAIDHLYEYQGPEYALHEAEYLHTLGSTVFDNGQKQKT